MTVDLEGAFDTHDHIFSSLGRPSSHGFGCASVLIWIIPSLSEIGSKFALRIFILSNFSLTDKRENVYCLQKTKSSTLMFGYFPEEN